MGIKPGKNSQLLLPPLLPHLLLHTTTINIWSLVMAEIGLPQDVWTLCCAILKRVVECSRNMVNENKKSELMAEKRN